MKRNNLKSLQVINAVLLILVFVFLFSFNALAQTGSIKGQIKDKEGSAVNFVTIGLLGSNVATVTDELGRYVIKNIPIGSYTLVISRIGFEKITKDITVKDGEVLNEDIITAEKTTQLSEITIIASRSINGIAHLDDISNTIIFAGKKNEVIILDSLNANTAQNNPRQVLGRIPGINFSETEGSGFPSNGVGFRGLNPSQSVETNTRQNGYNIAADIYGYPEAYYIPPLEAVERVEVVRGASSLQFGPQFGGLVNYVVKQGSKDKPFEYTSQQTMASYSSFTSFNSIGGFYKKFNYYGFVQYKTSDGWRPNSGFRSLSGFGRLQYQANSKLMLGLEYSVLRNKIHMPGGLTDDEFNQNSRQSFRTRNWLDSPWNIIAANLEYKISSNTVFSIKSAFLLSQRNLVWRNEDGGPGVADSISPVTNTYVQREVQREAFINSTTEARLLSTYNLLGMTNSVAAGIRYFKGKMGRQGGGPGSTGTDFDLKLYGGDYEYNLDFTTTNIAFFAENIFRITNKFSVTPGIRYEFINSTVKGYVTDRDSDVIVKTDASRSRYIPLAGIGTQYKITGTTNIYANISQAYRPIDYSTLTPLGVSSKIDPKMKDSDGYNADFGWRGTVKNYLNIDIGGFYMAYNNRVGLVERTDINGNLYTLRTNVANSVHQGIESYIEYDPIKMFIKNSRVGTISFFNSFSYVDAKYTTGEFKGNYVEYAPKTINRFGVTYSLKVFSITFLVSNTAKSFGDANNTVHSSDALVGIIPAYQVMDWSGRLKFNNYTVKFGLNNMANKIYFTKRTDEYPGPGIIPSTGRTWYVSFCAKF